LEVDVLIVGAGPAGSTTARYCADKDLDVLVIDRREEIGHPVQCGEFLPDTSEMYTMFPKTIDLEELFTFDESLKMCDIEHIDMISPKGKAYRCDFRGMTLDRRSFDKYLVKLAEESGARVEKKTSLLSIRDGVALTSLGEVKARVIVGADGPNSRTAMEMQLQRPRERYPAITCQAAGTFDPIIKMYFGALAPGGYAWIIPKKNGANIGVGYRPSISAERPSEVFRRFISRLGVSVRDVTMGFVPESGQVAQLVRGNVLLVGDAAGHVMASNGGGIPIAMIAGRFAGNAIRSHLRYRTTLESYERNCEEILGGPLSTSHWTKRFADVFIRHDWGAELAMSIARSRGLARAIRCKRVFYLA